MVEPAADRVRQQLAGERADEVFLVVDQQRPQSGDALESSAVGKTRRGLDRRVVASLAPFSQGIEILERKPERVHSLVTRRARWVLPMQLHPFAQRSRLTLAAGLLERGYVGRRRRWRGAEQIRQQPSSTHRH